MKRFAAKAMLAGVLVAGALGTAGAAAATEVYLGTDGAGVTASDGSGIGVGPNGITVSLPDTDYSATPRYRGDYGYGRGYGYGQGYGYGPCSPGYCR